MKNQYVGDIGDYGKYALAKKTDGQLAVVSSKNRILLWSFLTTGYANIWRYDYAQEEFC